MLTKPVPHPLRGELKRLKIPLWQVRMSLPRGVVMEKPSTFEAKLSRMLSGVDPMPPELAVEITKLVREARKQLG